MTLTSKNNGSDLPGTGRVAGLLTPGATKRERFAHLPYAVILPIYLVSFFCLEALVPTTGYWVSYLPVDDLIPFVEQFALFYALWYPMLGLLGFYLMFYDGEGFRKYMIYIGVSFMTVLLICAIFPNGQDLRPDLSTLGRSNVFTKLMEGIYTADTNTNVIPSMHVVGSFAVFFGLIENKKLRASRALVALCAFLAFMVSISTVFVKQHSILDGIVAVPYSIAIYFLLYKWIFRLHKKNRGTDE